MTAQARESSVTPTPRSTNSIKHAMQHIWPSSQQPSGRQPAPTHRWHNRHSRHPPGLCTQQSWQKRAMMAELATRF